MKIKSNPDEWDEYPVCTLAIKNPCDQINMWDTSKWKKPTLIPPGQPSCTIAEK